MSRFVFRLLALCTVGAPALVTAQAPSRVPQIAILRIGVPADASADALRQALRDLGYAEGRNIVIADRSAEDRVERLTDLAADLVRLKVDVIIAGGVAATRAAREATATIPIVMPSWRFIPIRSEPGSWPASRNREETSRDCPPSHWVGKRLQLLKETVPGISRVAVLSNPTVTTQALELADEVIQ